MILHFATRYEGLHCHYHVFTENGKGLETEIHGSMHSIWLIIFISSENVSFIMNCSVIIATRNRKTELYNALLSLNRQTLLPVEVIVVDSSDEPIFIDDSEFLKLSIQLFRSIPSLVVQRNAGLKQVSVTTEVVVFIDDDVELENEYLDKLGSVFSDRTVVGAQGFITNAMPQSRWFKSKHNGYVDKCARNFQAIDPGGNRDLMWLSGCNMAYRYETIKNMRFDEYFTAYGLGEDLEFSWRVAKLGCLRFVPEARLKHFESPVARLDNRKIGKMYFLNKWYIVRKHREYFSTWRYFFMIGSKLLFLFVSGNILKNTRNKDLLFGHLAGIYQMIFQSVFKQKEM